MSTGCKKEENSISHKALFLSAGFGLLFSPVRMSDTHAPHSKKALFIYT